MSGSSAEIVSNIEELLNQILIKVPALPLIRFQSVSKHWLSLISDPDFRRRHTLQNPNPKISAFFSSQTNEDMFKSIPVEIPSGNPFKTLVNLVPDASELTILQSCNGLFLCHIYEETKHHPVYVVNPTTNQFKALFNPSIERLRYPDDFVRYALAFDPAKSPHYKVVCFTCFSGRGAGWHKVDIYSSETTKWEHLDIRFTQHGSNVPFTPNVPFTQHGSNVHFDRRSREGAVCCNDAVYWIREGWHVGRLSFCIFRDGRREFVRQRDELLHYFDISEKRLGVMAVMPPVSSVVKNIPLKNCWFPTINPTWTQIYFGECGGCLHLVETYKHCMVQFDVMEMKRDYSGWFVKYHVDLNPLVAALPGLDWNGFCVLCLFQEEKDNGVLDSSTEVLLHMPGMVIAHNIGNGTFKTYVELANKQLFLASTEKRRMAEDDIFPLSKSLYQQVKSISI